MGKSRMLANSVNAQMISTNTSAEIGKRYVATASLTLTLPSAPVAGDFVSLQNSSGVTTIVVARNGSNIMSLAENMTVNVLNAGITLMYADATRGWVLV